MLDRTHRPDIAPMERIDIQLPERTTLPNGIRLNVLRAGTEDVIRMDVLIAAGIWHQELPLQALFANKMLREGTSDMTSAQISERLDFYGAWMELTSTMNYNYLTLYSLGKHFDRILPLVSSMLRQPTFPEREMQVLLEAERQQFLVNSAKVSTEARKAFSRHFFGTAHPSGRFAEKEDYDRLTTTHLRDFFRRHYHSGNCSVYLSGNVTSEVIASVTRELGTSPWGEVKPRLALERHPVPPFAGKRVNIRHGEGVQCAVRTGFPAMERTHPDFAKAKVLTTVLGGYFGSRLMKNIREEKGYTYGIASTLVSHPYQGVLTVSTETANEHVESCLQEIRHEMRRLQEELVPVRELEMVRNYMLGDLCRSHEGAFSLSDAWIFIESGGLDDGFFQTMTDAIRSVSPEELRELAQRYLRPDDSLEVVVGNI